MPADAPRYLRNHCHASPHNRCRPDSRAVARALWRRDLSRNRSHCATTPLKNKRPQRRAGVRAHHAEQHRRAGAEPAVPVANGDEHRCHKAFAGVTTGIVGWGSARVNCAHETARSFRLPRSAALHQAEIADPSSDSHDGQVRASTAASAIWRAAIEAALAKDELKPAIALHQRAADTLSPADAAALDRYIDGAREREAARGYVAGLLPSESDPSSRHYIEQGLAGLDAAHAAATAQNNADWPDNGSHRATNQHFIDVAFGRRKHDIIQARADLDRSVADWLAIPRQTERPPLDLWIQLRPDQQQAIDRALAKNAYFDQQLQSSVVSEPLTHDEVGVIPVADPTLYEECHEECLAKAEGGTTYGGADRFFSYRRCMRDCLQKKGDFDYLRPPKH